MFLAAVTTYYKIVTRIILFEPILAILIHNQNGMVCQWTDKLHQQLHKVEMECLYIHFHNQHNGDGMECHAYIHEDLDQWFSTTLDLDRQQIQNAEGPACAVL